MFYIPTIINIIEVILVTVPVLLTVAFITIAERKTMGSMQRRIGPNIVGFYGLLQPFADALKLFVKEMVTDEIIERLQSGELDIGLLATPVYESRLEEHPLFYEEFFVYASREEKLPKKK